MSDQADSQVPDASRIVQIAIAPNEIIADMWRQVLEDEGIVVGLQPTGAGSSFGTSALSEHVVLVREDQAELARTILADFESDDSESSDAE